MSSTKLARKNALATLRAKREGGTGAGVKSFKRDAASDSEDDDIYDEVTEEEYKSIVRGRLMEDNFIEDDDGSGYVDDGRDDWNNDKEGDEEEDEDSEDADAYYERTGRKKKKKRSGAAKTGLRGVSAASAYAKRPTAVAQPLKSSRTKNIDAYRPVVATAKEDDFMKSLLGGLGGESGGSALNAPAPLPHSARLPLPRKRKQGTNLERPSFNRLRRSPASPPSSDPPDLPSSGPDPDVHITGSDTPPWKLDADPSMMELDSTPSMAVKRMRAGAKLVPRNDIHSEQDIVAAPRRARSQSQIDPSLLDDFNNDMDTMNDDFNDDLGLSIRAPNGTDSSVGAGQKIDLARMNGSSVRAQAAKPTSVRVKAEHNDEPLISMPVARAGPTDAVPILRDSWRSIGAKLANVEESSGESDVKAPATSSSSSATQAKINAYESDGRLRFFWYDLMEHQGSIHLFGKVKDQSSGKFVSACLQVGIMDRCVYLLPREGATEDEVYDEFEELRSKHGIKQFMARWVKRSYAFELSDVPAESYYLKVKYGYDEPQLPLSFSGKTFSRAFGTNTSQIERFLIKRHIMGPCWLDVESADAYDNKGNGPLTWCKLELSVDDFKFVKPFAETDADAPRETPPLTVLSLSLRTVVNHKENKREIAAVAARTWRDISLDDPTPPEKLQSISFSVVRPLGDKFPSNFEVAARKGPTKIITAKHERALLNMILIEINKQDPDVIVGYEFSQVSLDILLHRMRDLKADQWSRLGRLRRQKWPALRQGFNVHVASGRLLCDLASDTAKGMIASTTWSLTEMCLSHLKVEREDIDPEDTVSFFDSLAPTPDRLIGFLRHNEVDAFFQMALACKVQLLSLTKQLTNLSGNSWARTLNGGRAERNEYILLHEFYRKKFICPDKLKKTEREQLAKEQQMQLQLQRRGDGNEEEDADDVKAAGSGKKDKFKGGLVFDPKRGLWDKYILVMDFNSLYPSLIQEFNIDFTTVDRKACNESPDEVDMMPEIPSSDMAQGVLPRMISTLVQRRRQVKNLMKDRNAPAAKQLQWNVKQLALKLTANSMYGCLGFEGSRFYARPLAALTTFKGRETLTATKELAESLHLDVIYGDTDSVMINTNVLDLAEARRIGAEFKRAVNERYRLLEIDIDGIFERMLLLQKKKYAAIKIEDDAVRTTEIKGLDMKRREYCALSKGVSKGVLGHILSGEATETVVEKIHEYLETVAQGMDMVALDDFIIFKRLSKNVNDYNEQAAKSLPHVQVAKRMLAKGISVRMGDVIPYVFCLGSDGVGSTKTAQADRAHHPDDIRRKDANLQIDMQYYLSLQILPPVERLCDAIEGTDRSRLAEHLGLDASKYHSTALHSSSSATDDRHFATLDSQTPDEIRFAACEPLTIDCPNCKAHVPFTGVPGLLHAQIKASGDEEDRKDAMKPDRMLTSNGLKCPECTSAWGVTFVAMQLEATVRRHIARYYQAWTVCTEPTCRTSTRMQGISARRCLVTGCRGKVAVQYGDKALYDQLCYLESLFDGQRALSRAQSALAAATAASAGTSSSDSYQSPAIKLAVRQVEALESRLMDGSRTRDALEKLQATVARYTARSGRRFIQLDSLFGWMKVIDDSGSRTVTV